MVKSDSDVTTHVGMLAYATQDSTPPPKNEGVKRDAYQMAM